MQGGLVLQFSIAHAENTKLRKCLDYLSVVVDFIGVLTTKTKGDFNQIKILDLEVVSVV